MNYGIRTLGLVLALTIVSCGSDQVPGKQKTVETPVEKVDYTEQLAEYRKFVEDLDIWNPKSSTEAVEKYSVLFKGADPEICDQAFEIFQNLYESIGFKLDEKIGKDTALKNSTCGYTNENGKEIKHSKALRKFESQIAKHGYEIECYEGMPSLGLDSKFVARNFYKSVSPTMRKFLKGLQEADDNEVSVDAAIVLTEKEFVDRVVWWESFVKENPDFILIKRAEGMKRDYFSDLIYGMNNTPAISYMSNGSEETISDLSDYFVTAYTYLNKKYPDSETNKLIKPFFKAAMARDFDKVEKIRKDYTKKGYISDYFNNY